MGPRFLAAIGISSPDRRREVERLAGGLAGFRPLLSDETMILFTDASPHCVRLADGGGAVLGPLFEDEQLAVSRLIEDEARQRAIVASAGRLLGERYWGGYVGLIRPTPYSIHVLRDPSGALPCYRLRRDDGLYLTSDVALLTACGLLRPSFSWPHVVRFLLSRDLRGRATALSGVEEVLPGERLVIEAGSLRSQSHWNPWHYAARGAQITRPAEVSQLVRRAVERAVAAWGLSAHHVLLGASGGLDSSIVAACLAGAGAEVTLLNLVAPGAAGDERRYARLVADRLRLPLREEYDDPALVDLTRSDAAHLPRPVARAFSQSGDRIARRVAAACGADALFNGGGGDGLFGAMHSVAPVLDRIVMEGIGAGAFATARDLAELTDAGVPRILLTALRRTLRRERGYRWPDRRHLLTRRASELAAPAFAHSWLARPAGELIGKSVHIAYILGIQNYLEAAGAASGLPCIAPLMSQPVLEACLRIPLWMSCADGRDRAVARTAFADLLPSAIFNRTGKGSHGPFVAGIVASRRTQIRALLHDGLLAAQGLIELDELDRLLAPDASWRGQEHLRIMDLVDVEAWLRSWSAGAAAQPRRA